jgi:hypothetical protein
MLSLESNVNTDCTPTVYALFRVFVKEPGTIPADGWHGQTVNFYRSTNNGQILWNNSSILALFPLKSPKLAGV